MARAADLIGSPPNVTAQRPKRVKRAIALLWTALVLGGVAVIASFDEWLRCHLHRHLPSWPSCSQRMPCSFGLSDGGRIGRASKKRHRAASAL